VRRLRPVRTSQSVAAPSDEVVTIRSPFGEIAAQRKFLSSLRVRVRISTPVAEFQTLAVWSTPVVIICLPSGEKPANSV
jgi:ribosomal protein L30/L7E